MDEKNELETEEKATEETTEKEATSINVEELAGLDLDVDLHDEETEKEEESRAEEKKVEQEKKGVKPPEPSVREKELEERTARLERDKNDLKKALHEARQERKKAKETESQVTLSDAELQKIVEEHKDDPKVMFNAVAYKVQQMMKAGKAETVNEVEVKQRRNELNTILKERIKDYENEDGEPRSLINRAKTDFNIEDHPYSDFLGAAAAVYMDLPNLIKGWMEEGKKQALNEKADNNRKTDIKKSQLTPGGSKTPTGKVKDSGLTPSQMETAVRMGFDKSPEKMKIFKSQILKGANA